MHSLETRQKISENNAKYFLGKHFSEKHKEKLKKNSGMKGTNYFNLWVKKYGEDIAKEKMKELKKKIGDRQRGIKKNKKSVAKMIKTKTGKSLSSEHIKSIRLGAIKRIKNQNGQVKPNYNPKSISIIEEYGKSHGYNFQHAINGGEFHIKELGYWVDGYDKEKNIIIEYYEKAHIRSKDRDKRRKQEIINHLGCTFIEIKEWEMN